VTDLSKRDGDAVGELTERRVLPESPELVWQALTSANSLEQWFWPSTFATRAEADARLGGAYRIVSPVAEMAVSGRYTRVLAPETLSFSWQWDGEDTESAVAVTLAASDGGTELVVTHTGLAETEIANHVQGWSDCLDRLPAFLASCRAE
jgi:uncharacterized protein YndB with AHSA1/START domain